MVSPWDEVSLEDSVRLDGPDTPSVESGLRPAEGPLEGGYQEGVGSDGELEPCMVGTVARECNTSLPARPIPGEEGSDLPEGMCGDLGGDLIVGHPGRREGQDSPDQLVGLRTVGILVDADIWTFIGEVEG